MGDTQLNNTLKSYLDAVKRLEFEEVLAIKFRHREAEDTFFIFARRDGVLLGFDTYNGNAINGGKIYYNWEPRGQFDWSVTSSGRMHTRTDREIWIGDHDCRQMLAGKIAKLTSNGSFVSPWIERPFLWLLHHGDPKDADYKLINAERIALLPAWVQAFIGPAA